MQKCLVIACCLLCLNFILFKIKYDKPSQKRIDNVHIDKVKPEIELKNYKFEDIINHLSYEETKSKVSFIAEKTNSDFIVYGKSTNDLDLFALKLDVDNEKDKAVLITSCIHGNEPLSAAMTINYMRELLDKYNDDQETTDLLNNIDFYFVPIVSPDSYPLARHVDGVDPNRDFPTKNNLNKKSVPPVEALKKLFIEIKPIGVMSGHTFGRMYLIPYADNNRTFPEQKEYSETVGKMAAMSNYKIVRTSAVYKRPIFGTEIDWYVDYSRNYKNASHTHKPFVVISEYGTHQRTPTNREIKEEFDRTYKAFLYFCQHLTK